MGQMGLRRISTRRETSVECGGSCAVVLPSRKRGFSVLVSIFRIISVFYIQLALPADQKAFYRRNLHLTSLSKMD